MSIESKEDTLTNEPRSKSRSFSNKSERGEYSGAMTFGITTLCLMTFGILTLSIMTLRLMTFGTTTVPLDIRSNVTH